MNIVQTFKNKVRYTVMWVGLGLIILLIFFSIYGAFLGPQRAEDLFNSLPLAVYWLVFTVLLIVALMAFRRLRRMPELMLIHLGCVLILSGSMCGSHPGHQLQKRLYGIDKVKSGRMLIYERQTENQVVLENSEQTKELPFSLRLKDFRIEYYQPQYLHVQTSQAQTWKIPVEIGREFSLGPDFGIVTIVRSFKNFKITIDGDKRTAYDSTEPGLNAALEVRFKDPDGTITTRYVFERFAGHPDSEAKFLPSYRRTISDYVSELQIIKDGKIVAEKDIEVNHPLYFGGYHFYQDSYDDKAGRFSILKVVSDTGLGLVYVGYFLLCLGVFWHFWLRRIFRQIKPRSE